MSERLSKKPNKQPQVERRLPRAIGDLSAHINAPLSVQNRVLPHMVRISSVQREGIYRHPAINALRDRELSEATRGQTKKQLSTIIDAGGELFGVVRFFANAQAAPRIFLTAFSKRPDQRAQIVGELAQGGEALEAGRKHVPGNSLTVSKRHFNIRAMTDGALFVNDLGSSNGTEVIAASGAPGNIPFTNSWVPTTESILAWEQAPQAQVAQAVGAAAVPSPDFLPPTGQPVHNMFEQQ